MKACVIQGPGELGVDEVDRPRAESGELLLRVHDCGICGSDLHAVHSLPPGTIFGHEFSGEVVEIGEGVDDWTTGDRVVSLPFFSCGRCASCRRGEGIFCAEIRGLGLGQLPGAYAEFVRVQPANCLRVPETVGWREAALVEPLAVGLHGVRRSRLASGDTCIILGAGPIGIATLLWARALGAKTIVSDPAPGRRGIAESLGATAVVDPGRDEPAFVAQDVSPQGVAVVFECVGVKSLLQQAMTMAPLRSQIVVLGVCMDTDEIFPLVGVLKELRIDFVLGYSRPEFQETLEALVTKRLEAGQMITDVVGIERVPEMFHALAAPNTQCKVLIEFER